MKTILTGLAIAALSATPALAQDREKPREKPKMCEMMQGGKRMQGMMVKGEDGKMTCKMMDHSKMDPSNMDHSKMGHGKKPEAAVDKPKAPHKHD